MAELNKKLINFLFQIFKNNFLIQNFLFGNLASFFADSFLAKKFEKKVDSHFRERSDPLNTSHFRFDVNFF